MSYPAVFDDLCKKASDVLNDDYFVGSKMTMKVKNIKGMSLTAEAKATEGKPVVSKISGDFAPCTHCNFKKLSVDNMGAMVADVDVTKLIRNTTFTIRTQKNLCDSGIAKAAVGAKVMTESVAFDTSFDMASQRYNAGLVYGYKGARVGLKVRGDCSSKPMVDMGASYAFEKVMVSCVGYNLAKSADVSVFYAANEKTRVGCMCKVRDLKSVPEVCVGVASKVAENTELRGKASSSGVVSGCFKTTVDGKMTFSGCLSVDCKNLSAENNRVGFGVEYLF